MAQRFSRILEAAKLYSAVDNYLKYITDSTKRGTRVGQGESRPASKSLFLKPFAFDLAADQRVRQTAAETTWNAVSGLGGVGSRVTATLGANTVIKISNYKAPRVVYVTGRSDNGVAKTSAITGLKYLSYGGKSRSFPFGKSGDTDTVSDAFTAIKTSVETGIAGAIVSLQNEVY